jgi:mevalonate pyrophosphate decarboxylase
MKEQNVDMVSHPPHYQSNNGIEVIDVIEAFTADLQGIEATDTGNVIKYICRWKHKNGLEDLEKAKWYINHLIKRVKRASKKEKKA